MALNIRWMPVALALVATAACQKEPEKAVQEAEKATAEANQKADNAMAKANEQSAQAYDKAAASSERAYDKAADKWAEASQTLVSARNDYVKSATDKLTDIDKDLVDIRAKIEKTTKVVPADVDAEWKGAKARLEGIRGSVRDINYTAPQAFTATKTDLDAKIDEIKKAVDDLKKRARSTT